MKRKKIRNSKIKEHLKLRNKIHETYSNLDDFAIKIKMSPQTFSAKMNRKIDFKTSEMINICNELNIPHSDIELYFF